MHWDTFKDDNTVGGDRGCSVGEVRACTTSPMLDYKTFKLDIHPLHFWVNFQKFRTKG